MDPSLLSRVLRGLRPKPRDFDALVNRALTVAEKAERAADAARQRVLREEGAA